MHNVPNSCYKEQGQSNERNNVQIHSRVRIYESKRNNDTWRRMNPEQGIWFYQKDSPSEKALIPDNAPR